MRPIHVGLVAAGAMLALSACGSGGVGEAASSAAAGAASAAASAAKSAAASAAASSISSAGCSALQSVGQSVQQQTQPAVTVGQAIAAIDSSTQQLQTVSQEAGPVQQALVVALTTAENTYKQRLQTYPAETPLSQTSATAQAAGQAVQTAYTSLSKALACGS